MFHWQLQKSTRGFGWTVRISVLQAKKKRYQFKQFCQTQTAATGKFEIGKERDLCSEVQ